MKSSCPKHSVNASTAPNFCHGSVMQQRISWGGGGCKEPVFLNSLHGHIGSGTKEASAIGPQLWGEMVSTSGRGQEGPISSGLFSPHARWCVVPKLTQRKGLVEKEIILNIKISAAMCDQKKPT
jgi:hypothetical protein